MSASAAALGDPMVMATAVALAAGIGLVIGSFLNVVIWRLPRGESLATPGSACPKCGHAIRARDNVPVASWLLLRGRCRDCGARISARYPVVELATGALFAVVAWWALVGGGRGLASPLAGEATAAALLALAAFLYLAAVSIALAMIDLDTHTLPNRIVLPAYAVGAVLLGASSVAAGDLGSALRGATGMAILFVGYLIMALAYPGGMGFGDVKLAGVLGLYLGWLGWGELAVGAFAAFVLGGVFSVVLLATRKVSRKGGIPFGPWMLAGAWTGIFAGGAIWVAYLSMFGLGAGHA